MSTDLRNVMERISAEYYQLTTSERKVADYITDHQPGTQIMSISDLAEASGVAEATITRFCRKLGYKGYNAFKLALANNVARRRGIPFLSGEVTPDDDIQEMCHKLYGAEVDAISQTLTLIRPEEIIRAADLLTRADKVLCMGQGGSMIMAEEAAHIFATAGMSFFALSDSHIQIVSVTALTPRDAILFFSYSGATRESAGSPAGRARYPGDPFPQVACRRLCGCDPAVWGQRRSAAAGLGAGPYGTAVFDRCAVHRGVPPPGGQGGKGAPGCGRRAGCQTHLTRKGTACPSGAFLSLFENDTS